MMKRILMTALAMVALASPALAADVTASDFVAKASESGMAEVQLGQLAVNKAESADVRAFGQRMVTDHGKANTELATLASRKGLTVSKELNAKHKKAVQDLGAKSGEEFDKAFAQQMVTDHSEAVALFTAASKLDDRDLAGFATRTLPVLQDHHEKSRQLAGSH